MFNVLGFERNMLKLKVYFQESLLLFVLQFRMKSIVVVVFMFLVFYHYYYYYLNNCNYCGIFLLFFCFVLFVFLCVCFFLFLFGGSFKV